jgi:hypothetical protein
MDAVEASRREVEPVRDLSRVLDGLRDQLAGIQREIFVLDRIGRELTAISLRCDDAALDLMIRHHLDEIAGRMALALDTQRSIRRMMEEDGAERRRVRSSRVIPVRWTAPRRLSSARPIAGRAKST